MSSLFTYAHAFQRCRNQAFVILALGRSGSTLLTQLLNSHPDVRCEQEILRRRRLSPYLYASGRRKLADPDTFGFKVKVWHLSETNGIGDPATFLLRLRESGWRFVYLWRRNVLRSAISTLLADARRCYHVTDVHEQAELLSSAHRLLPDDVIQKIGEILRYRSLEKRLMAKIPHIEVNYEDGLLDQSTWQSTANRVFQHLDIEYAPVHSDLKRTVQGQLRDLIPNFGEIEARARQAGYSEYLEPLPI